MPGPHRIADRRDLGEPREQPVDERAVGVARAGMHDEPGRLRDHDDVVVGVAHVDRDRRVGARAARRRRGLAEHLDHAALVRAGGSSRPARPSTSTAPPSSNACTSARGQPVRNATARSTRSPSSAAGTTNGSSITALDASDASRLGREQRAHDEHDRADRDARVGDVEHRAPADRDEVDDVAAQEARATGRCGRRGCRARRRARARARRGSSVGRAAAPRATTNTVMTIARTARTGV